MRAFIKRMFSYKMARHNKRKALKNLLKTYGLSIVYKKETSITLNCLGIGAGTKRNRVNLTDTKGNILETNIKEADVNTYIKQYQDAAKKQYPDLTTEQALTKYVGDLVKSKRKRIKVKNPEDIGKVTSSGIVKIDLVDDLGNFAGRLTRSSKDKGRTLYYTFQTAKGQKRNISSTVSLFDKPVYNLPIKQGEKIIYGDINIPKNITNELSGLGKTILDDTLGYFLNNSKFGNVDGIVGMWTKNKTYYDSYGGKSVNLTKFWENMLKTGNNIEKSAFSTFTGDWAKNNGFMKVSYRKKDINDDYVSIKFLK